MLDSFHALWPPASAAASIAFLATRPWKRPGGILASVAASGLALTSLVLFLGGPMEEGSTVLSVLAALCLVAFGATASGALGPANDSVGVPQRPGIGPRPSPCADLDLVRYGLDQSEPPVAVSRLDGELVFVNTAWAKLHGLRPGDAVGHRWSLFHTPEQMERELRPLLVEAEARGFAEARVGRRRPDGETFLRRTRVTLIADPDTGAAIGWMATALPDAARVEAAVADFRQEVEPGDSAAADLAEFGRSVRRKLHDFNNLLGAVVGNAGLVLERLEHDPEARREVEEIESAALRAAELTNALQSEARRMSPPDEDSASLAIGPSTSASLDSSVAALAASGSASSVEKATSSSGSVTVLVVDNEKVVRDVARSALTARGYRVLTAEDGEAAVEIFREHHAEIRVVFLDLGMPRMDGREAFEHLRAIDPDARIVLMTGFRDGDLVADLERRGLCGSLPKPFRPKTLLETLESVLAD